MAESRTDPQKDEPATPAGQKPTKSLSDEVAEAFGAIVGPKPAIDELADREKGSPGPLP